MIKLLIKHQLIDYCIKYACDIIIGNFKNIDLLEDFLKAYPVFSITFKEDRIINMGTMSYDTGCYIISHPDYKCPAIISKEAFIQTLKSLGNHLNELNRRLHKQLYYSNNV